jgi:hypothetical protein
LLITRTSVNSIKDDKLKHLNLSNPFHGRLYVITNQYHPHCSTVLLAILPGFTSFSYKMSHHWHVKKCPFDYIKTNAASYPYMKAGTNSSTQLGCAMAQSSDSPLTANFDPRPVHVRFLVEAAVMGQVYHQILWF